LLHRASLIQII